MIREQQQYFLPLHVAADFLCAATAFCLCAPLAAQYAAGYGFTLESPPIAGTLARVFPLAIERYLRLIPLMTVLPLLFLGITRSYARIGIQSFFQVIRALAPGLCLISVFFVSSLAINPQPTEIHLFIALCTLCSWALFIINRLCIAGAILHYRGTGNLTKFLLVIGTDEQARETAALCEGHPEWGIRIVGFLTHDAREVGNKICSHSIVGHADDLSGILSEQVVDCVLFTGGTTDLAKVHALALQCETEGIDFGLAASLINDTAKKVSTDLLFGVQAILFKSVAHSPAKLFIKRLIDIALAAACIILLLPLWIVLPLIIKRDSPGSVFFCHERVGRHGRRFTMYKFRTMVPGADKMQERLAHLNEMDGPVFKIKDDPRFTGIGRFLRTTSIDELPQLFNVIKGDMSLVGPRPPVVREVLQYQPWQKKRLSVIPGITCLWQVTGRNEIKFDEWMQLDLQYIENWSLTLDLKILLRTVTAVLSRRGAN